MNLYNEQVRDQLQDNYNKKQINMGCGALCGNSSSVAQTIQASELRLKKIIPFIAPNGFLYSVKVFASFLKELQLNPSNYHLSIPNKLQQKRKVKPTIMEKWKAILYGLDFDKSAYVKCLGYPENIRRIEEDKNKQKQGNRHYISNSISSPSFKKTQIVEHECFHQIEKDLDRTFHFPDFQRSMFSLVLKRISNHFPIMGYTQGINFIVGYFLIIGYSEEDAFWLFTHIALNKKYMLLGLFEDGFPLSNVYLVIFKNILKRQNLILYEHIYENLGIDDSLWIFKWFITYYIYSFPLEMCQYVWDLVITIGGVGLITFAVGLVKALSKYLLDIEDHCEMSQFFFELKNIESFNKYVNLKEVMSSAYYIEIQQRDMEGLQDLKGPDGEKLFYAEYFLAYYEEIKAEKEERKVLNKSSLKKVQSFNSTNPTILKKIESKKESSSILERWYEKITNERRQFVKKKTKKKRRQVSKEDMNLKLIYHDKQQSQFDQIRNSRERKIMKKVSIQDQPFQDQLDKLQNQLSTSNHKIKTNPNEDLQSIGSKRGIKQRKIDLKQFFDPDEDQEKKQKQDKMEIDDSLFYFPSNINLKKNNDLTYARDFKSFDGKGFEKKFDTRTEKGIRPQILMAGKSIVNSMSISNASNRSSVSSKKTIQKQNHSGRECKCKREDSSDLKSYKPRKNVEESVRCREQSNFLKPTDKNDRKKTKNWVVNSEIGKKHKDQKEMNCEVQIIETKMFKKKNRHNEGDIKITNIESDSKMGSNQREEIIFPEQSCDSMFVANFSSRISEIESVK